MNRQSKQIYNGLVERINQQAHVFTPFREDMSSYFEWAKELKEKEWAEQDKPLTGPNSAYERRPLIGLQIQIDDRYLAIKLGWQKAHMGYLDDERTVWACKKPGEMKLAEVWLELLDPGKQMTLVLTPHAAKLRGRFFLKPEINFDNLHVIVKTCHRLMKSPWETFAASGALSNRCSQCRKELTVLESQVHGIGPECIKMFNYFERERPGLKAYLQKYRTIDDPWETQEIQHHD